MAFALARKKMLYSRDEEAHFRRSKTIEKYLVRKATASPSTAQAYRAALAAFSQFVMRVRKAETDALVEAVKAGTQDPYDILAEFALFLKKERTGDLAIRPNTLTYYDKCAKRFFRFSGVKAINNEDFREQVSLPRREVVQKAAADKKMVITLLNAASVKMRTFIMFTAVYGPRPIEACAVRNIDLDMQVGDTRFRAEFSKMRVERTRRMTKELARQVKVWLAKKYKPHRTTVTHEDGTTEQVYVTPQPKPDDLLFAPWTPSGEVPRPDSVYKDIQAEFGDLVDAVGLGKWEEGGKRREITLYSIGRRFAKTTISDLGFSDFSEFWVGHSASTYYRKTDAEVLKMFSRVEPSLTFLDPTALEQAGADLTAKIEAMQKAHDREIAELRASTQQQITALQAALMAKEALHQYFAVPAQQQQH